MSKKGRYEKRTKIVCTIGPATETGPVIKKIITAGMNVARLNLSHGTRSVHSRYIKQIRAASRQQGVKVALLMDLPGPKYRTGALKNGRAVLKKGADFVISTIEVEGDASLVSVNLPSLPKDVKVGDTVLLDDGAIRLKVLKKESGGVRCKVMDGGILTPGRGLVVPGMKISRPFITDALRENIAFAIKENPEYLALSFVSTAGDVEAVRKILRESNADIPIITKIERGEAVDNFDSILAVSDGIMVARGDLGVDIPLERVPLVQKEIIRKCNRAGKPVITATQMLESMINAARPTRAEVTDVANAIFDGTDATMLSAETSIGSYPVRAVATMAKIAQETESKLPYEKMLLERGSWLGQEIDEMIAYNACRTAHSLGAAAIVAFTQSGSTAQRVSRYRPRVPILATTPSEIVSGRLMLYWGVYPSLTSGSENVNDLFATGARMAQEIGIARKGDLIVITGGIPIGEAGSTNLLKVERIT